MRFKTNQLFRFYPIFLFIILFLFSELVLIGFNVNYGIWSYFLSLIFLFLLLSFCDFQEDIQNLLGAMTILPIIRFIGSLMPLENFSFLMRVGIVYAIMAIGMISILFIVKIKDMHKWKGSYFFPVAILAGLGLGYLEYLILRPSLPFESFSWGIFLLGFLFIFSTGFIEEIIFRGVLQNLFMKVFNPFISILLLNILFITMHLVWKNAFEIMFVFFIGIMLSLIYYKTRNLILISLVHSSINLSLFIIFPIVFSK